MCHVVGVEVTVFLVEQVAAFAVEQAAAYIAWMASSVAGFDVCVAWAGVEKFAVVDTAAGLASAAESGLAV